MALTTRLSFVSVDKTGRAITLKDTTGVYSEENSGGYGDPNPIDFRKIIFSVSKFSGCKNYQVEQSDEDSTAGLPTMADIMNGEPIHLNSTLLGITEADAGLQAFSDGVLDIDMYHVFPEIEGITGNQGDLFITGNGLIAENFSHLYIQDKLYTINKSLPTNGGIIIHLKECLEADVTSYSPVVSANAKAMVKAASDEYVSKNIGRTAVLLREACERNVAPDTNMTLSILFKFAADIAFDCKDYKQADELLDGAQSFGTECGGRYD